MLTDFGAATANQKKLWLMQTFVQGRDQSFWNANGFMGKNTDDDSKPIHKVTDLTETERGAKAVMTLVADIEGAVVGDNLLDGQEKGLDTDTQEIQIDQIRNGVKNKGFMSEQKTILRFRAQAKDKLAFWRADLLDELTFLTIHGRAYSLKLDGSSRGTTQLTQLSFASDVTAASTNRIMFAGTATSEATLTTADTMTWNLIIQAKAFAKRKRIRPVRAGGREFYIVVLSTEQCRDLEQSADFKSLNAQAMPRGLDNPLFTNAKKVIGDIVLYDHAKIFNTLGLSSGSKWGAASTVDGAQAVLLGAQAVGYAQLLNRGAGWTESKNDDHGNRPAIGIGMVCGFKKPVFISKYDANADEDFGTVAIKTAARAN